MTSLTRSVAFAAALVGLACPGPDTPRARTTLRVDGGLFSLQGELGTATPISLRNAEMRVRIDGHLRSSNGAQCSSDASAEMRCDLGDGLTLSLRSETVHEGILLTATLSGAGHRVDGFELVTTKAADAELALASADTPLRYLHNGYQSWSFSGALTVPDDVALARVDDVIAYPAPNGNVATDESRGLSSHSVIIDAGDGSAMLLGFVTANRWQSAVGLETSGGHHRLMAFNGFTGDSASTDSPVDSETLLVAYAKSPSDAMTAYGEALRSRQATRSVPMKAQNGWFSWNRFFANIDEATVLAQTAAMKDLVGDQRFDLVEVDDGWETAWGDWTPNERFSAIAALATTVHARGQRLGLWVAPFVVEANLPIVEEHPDWWVRKLDGQPLIHSPALTGHHLRVVDLTHPEARAWAIGNLRALEQAGVDFLKLDYLYAGALDGLRSEPNSSGVAALRVGMAAVFSGLDHAFINLCGVPWLHAALSPPSTIRTGTDVSLNGAPYGFVLVSTAARDTAARSFGPLSARTDPDQFLLAPLTADERQTALILQAISGESFALADDLVAADAALKDVIRTAASHRVVSDAPLVVHGLFDHPGDRLAGSPIEELLVDANHVASLPPAVVTRAGLMAATNWGDTAEWIDLGLDDKLSATAVWGPAPEGGRVWLNAHSSTLLKVSP